MTQDRPSRRNCLPIWSLLVLLPLLAIAAVALPWARYNADLNESIGTAENRLLVYRRAIATLPALRAELERVNANDDLKAFYFSAKTPALIGAELQRKVQDIVTAAQGRLISTQLLPEEGSEQPARTRVRTQIQGSSDTLVQILYGLEEARPFLFVEQLSLRSSARSEPAADLVRGRPVRRPGMGESGELTIRLDIFGFALPGASG